jgi:hypothetical protein
MRGSQSAPGRLARSSGASEGEAPTPSRPRRTMVPRSNTRRMPRAFARPCHFAERRCPPLEKKTLGGWSSEGLLGFRAERSRVKPLRLLGRRSTLRRRGCRWLGLHGLGCEDGHPRARPPMAPWALARCGGPPAAGCWGEGCLAAVHGNAPPPGGAGGWLRAGRRPSHLGRWLVHPSDRDGSWAAAEEVRPWGLACPGLLLHRRPDGPAVPWGLGPIRGAAAGRGVVGSRTPHGLRWRRARPLPFLARSPVFVGAHVLPVSFMVVPIATPILPAAIDDDVGGFDIDVPRRSVLPVARYPLPLVATPVPVAANPVVVRAWRHGNELLLGRRRRARHEDRRLLFHHHRGLRLVFRRRRAAVGSRPAAVRGAVVPPGLRCEPRSRPEPSQKMLGQKAKMRIGSCLPLRDWTYQARPVFAGSQLLSSA